MIDRLIGNIVSHVGGQRGTMEGVCSVIPLRLLFCPLADPVWSEMIFFLGEARHLHFYVKFLNFYLFEALQKKSTTLVAPCRASGQPLLSSSCLLNLPSFQSRMLPCSEMCIFPASPEWLLNSLLFVSAGSTRWKVKKINVL